MCRIPLAQLSEDGNSLASNGFYVNSLDGRLCKVGPSLGPAERTGNSSTVSSNGMPGISEMCDNKEVEEVDWKLCCKGRPVGNTG